MTPDATDLLRKAAGGDAAAAAELLPLVYDELRRLAAGHLAAEKPGQTLQPTALVHEAYLRLVGNGDPGWHGRGHFFAAAATAFRRILVEQARRRTSAKRGGGRGRIDLADLPATAAESPDDLLDFDALLDRLAAAYPAEAEFVRLVAYAGLTHADAAAALGVSARTAGRYWAFARAWLRREWDSGNSVADAARG